MKDPLAAFSRDLAGNAGVGFSVPRQEDSAQIMAAIRLYYGVGVHAGLESRPESHDDLGHVDVGAEVALGDYRVN
jgi:hypothetical protein